MRPRLTVLRKLLIVSVIILGTACREFYDEEFEDDSASQSLERDRAYSAILTSTDSSLPLLVGKGIVDVKDGWVTVDVTLSGIPQNIVQVHYSFTNEECDSVNISIPNEAGATRDYVISEKLSLAAFQSDLESFGASTSEGDINLLGKSMVVKAFTTYEGVPSPTGTNVYYIACGPFIITTRDTAESGESTDQDTETN